MITHEDRCPPRTRSLPFPTAPLRNPFRIRLGRLANPCEGTKPSSTANRPRQTPARLCSIKAKLAEPGWEAPRFSSVAKEKSQQHELMRPRCSRSGLETSAGRNRMGYRHCCRILATAVRRYGVLYGISSGLPIGVEHAAPSTDAKGGLPPHKMFLPLVPQRKARGCLKS